MTDVNYVLTQIAKPTVSHLVETCCWLLRISEAGYIIRRAEPVRRKMSFNLMETYYIFFINYINSATVVYWRHIVLLITWLWVWVPLGVILRTVDDLLVFSWIININYFLMVFRLRDQVSWSLEHWGIFFYLLETYYKWVYFYQLY